MNCPSCRSDITKPGRFCVSCGHDFGDELSNKLSFYFGLKDEFEELGRVQDSLSTGLANIFTKIQNYEKLLEADLRNAPGSPAPGKKMAAEYAPTVTDKTRETAPVATVVSSAPGSSSAERGRKDTSDLEIRLGQKWLLIAGLLTMVFGVGYFLKYSFEQGWVGPAGRVAMAYLWGIVFLVAGDRFRKKGFGAFGLSLAGGGIAVLYFATFAAFQIYHLFNQTPSFLIMVLITVLASLLAILYDAKGLAVMGLVGGFLTPVLLTTGQDNQIALMTYMTILNLGLLSVAFYKKWDILNSLGFSFTYLLYTAWYASHYAEHKFWPAIIFLNIFFLIYSVAPFAYQFFRKSSEQVRGFTILILNSLFAFGYSYAMVRGHFSLPWVSVISLFYTLVFLSLATFLYRRRVHQQEAFVVFLAKAALFLIITVPIIFSRHWITVFWAVQGLTLLWMGATLDRKGLRAAGYGLLGITVWKFLFHDYSGIFLLDFSYGFAIRNGYTNLLVERLTTSVVLLIMIFVAGSLARRDSLRTFSPDHPDAPAVFGVWGALLFIILNVEVSSFFYEYLPQGRFAAISVLWTLFSVSLMLLGFKTNASALRKASFGLFLATALKVFLFDMANVSTPYRIISFIILGLVLVGTSYLYYKFKDRIISVMAEDRSREQD
jgi:uncharacterized membrane protein